MGASSLMGSCSILAVSRPVGEVMGSSCGVDHSGSAEGRLPARWYRVVRWNRGGKQRTTAVMLLRHCWPVGSREAVSSVVISCPDRLIVTLGVHGACADSTVRR